MSRNLALSTRTSSNSFVLIIRLCDIHSKHKEIAMAPMYLGNKSHYLPESLATWGCYFENGNPISSTNTWEIVVEISGN
jgi:hypothetical protein